MKEELINLTEYLKITRTKLLVIGTNEDIQEVKNAHSYVDKAISSLENELRNPKHK